MKPTQVRNMFSGLARCGKSCRLRWMNYLRPDVKRGNYTQEEDQTIVKLHTKFGNRYDIPAYMIVFFPPLFLHAFCTAEKASNYM